MFLSVIFMIQTAWAQQPTPSPLKIIHKTRAVKGVEIKRVAKPDETDKLKWQKIVVGQQAIDGATLMGLPKDSVWRRLGLRSGDIIIKVNEKQLRSPQDLSKALDGVNRKVDTSVNFEIIRQNQVFLIDYKVTW